MIQILSHSDVQGPYMEYVQNLPKRHSLSSLCLSIGTVGKTAFITEMKTTSAVNGFMANVLDSSQLPSYEQNISGAHLRWKQQRSLLTTVWKVCMPTVLQVICGSLQFLIIILTPQIEVCDIHQHFIQAKGPFGGRVIVSC